MNKKWLYVLLTGVMAVGVLSGCGDTEEDPTMEEEPAMDEEPAGEEDVEG
ncbi:hypothetical protein [Salibacterium salarium]|nr:hypothetical protein [Salibacterium salarium]